MRAVTTWRRLDLDRSIEDRAIALLGPRVVLALLVAACVVAGAVGQVLIGRDGWWIAAGAAVFAVAGHRSPAVTVGLWAALLRLDHVAWLPMRVPDGWRAAGAAFVVFRLVVSIRRVRTVAPWVVLAVVIVAVRLAFAVGTGDGPARSIAFTLAAALLAATVAAVGRDSTRPLLIGLAAGATLSASVAVLQMTGLARFTTIPEVSLRFPGMAVATTALTWHLAFGAVCLLHLRRRWTDRRRRLAVHAALLVVALALVSCGSQGGLIALLVVAAIELVRHRHRVSLNATTAAIGAVVVAIVAVLMITSVIDSIPPEKGFVNELARADIADDAIAAIADQPLRGPGFTAFNLEHGNQPHLLPLHLGVVAGVLGLVLGLGALAAIVVTAVRAWRRASDPEDDDRSITGAHLLTIIAMWATVEPAGPFGADLGFTVLLLGVLLAAPPAMRSSQSTDRRPLGRARA